MDVAEQKKELRKMISGWNKQFPNELKRQQEQAVFAILERLPEFVRAKRIGFYWSMKDEFKTHDFITKWCGIKEFYLPKVENSDLKFCKFDDESSMVENSEFSILEPIGAAIETKSLDLLIVPGVGFTIRGNRLGRGGGFYDRVLRMKGAYSVALCYDFQVITELPHEEHDERVDLVLYKG